MSGERWYIVDASGRVMTSAWTRWGARRWLSRIQQANPPLTVSWTVRRAGGERNG